MLNNNFSKKVLEKHQDILATYVLPVELAVKTVENNSGQVGSELRLQEIYTEEIWRKLDSLGMKEFSWNTAKVLDVASGAGFLSYHLLKRITPAELHLADISLEEVEESKKLLISRYPSSVIEYSTVDVLQSGFPDHSFDVIIGNSFLHHFYDLPKALQEFKRMLKSGGVFISLHEPTVPAVAHEYKNPILTIWYWMMGKDYLNLVRYKGEDIAPGGGADVWIFEQKDIAPLFKKVGFNEVRIGNWNFFRPMVVSFLHLHQSKEKPVLQKWEILFLRLGIGLDGFLQKILPAKAFGSVSVLARNEM